MYIPNPEAIPRFVKGMIFYPLCVPYDFKENSFSLDGISLKNGRPWSMVSAFGAYHYHAWIRDGNFEIFTADDTFKEWWANVENPGADYPYKEVPTLEDK